MHVGFHLSLIQVGAVSPYFRITQIRYWKVYFDFENLIGLKRDNMWIVKYSFLHC